MFTFADKDPSDDIFHDGYGKSQFQLEGKVVTIEIRTLNAMQADVNMRLPYLFREKEAEIRSRLIAVLERGKKLM